MRCRAPGETPLRTRVRARVGGLPREGIRGLAGQLVHLGSRLSGDWFERDKIKLRSNLFAQPGRFSLCSINNNGYSSGEMVRVLQ